MRYDSSMYTGRQQKEIADFVASLPAMSDDELTAATRKFIWPSAYATNNARSAYHPMCDATYDEWVRRENVEGYSKAHAAEMRAAGCA